MVYHIESDNYSIEGMLQFLIMHFEITRVLNDMKVVLQEKHIGKYFRIVKETYLGLKIVGMNTSD